MQEKKNLFRLMALRDFCPLWWEKLQKWLSPCQQEVSHLVVDIMMVSKETEGMEPEAGLGGNCKRPALKNSPLPSRFFHLQKVSMPSSRD